ncbi:MAG: trypsin-like peptidase domain-containing protein [Gemmatimonadota bacterium]|nr:trypsin-like peptidase domain-containing protein [Gemmatimonadota bacterium]
MKTWVRVFLAIAFPLGIAAGLAVAVSSAADVGAIPNEASAAAAVAAQDIPATSPRLTPIVAAARSVAPSVVSVTVLRTVRQSSRRSLMEEFFGRIPRQAERQVSGLGSGFAINDNGFVVTNEHVVSGADSIVVTDAQGRRLRAELVGADALTDIAVLKVEAGRIPPAPLGTSSDLMVGEPAIAIGNPLGYFVANGEATVTAGVISGVARDIRDSDDNGSLFADMIQTDAAINPGNSGGALVNAEGRVIGVNSSILSRSGGSEGLGFAIPIDRALRIADELRDFGRIRRPWIGVDPEIVASDTTLFSSTRVRRVAPGSPAEAAGLETGDVLVEVDGRRIDSPLDLDVGLLDAGVGATVRVTYERAGREATTTLAVVELPSEQAARIEVLTGLQLVTVNTQIAIERRLPQEIESGALIVEISPENSRFSGLARDDVIVAINRQRIHTAEEADDLFRSFAGGSRIWATVVRDGRLINTQSFYVR